MTCVLLPNHTTSVHCPDAKDEGVLSLNCEAAGHCLYPQTTVSLAMVWHDVDEFSPLVGLRVLFHPKNESLNSLFLNILALSCLFPVFYAQTAAIFMKTRIFWVGGGTLAILRRNAAGPEGRLLNFPHG